MGGCDITRPQKKGGANGNQRESPTQQQTEASAKSRLLLALPLRFYPHSES